ncbi:MAG: hypothetical protein AAFY59_13085 [Pseudomonadota bacterium]
MAVLGNNTLNYLSLLRAYLIFAVVGLSIWAAGTRKASLCPWHFRRLLAHLTACLLALRFPNWTKAEVIPTNGYLNGVFIVADGLFVGFYTLGARKAVQQPVRAPSHKRPAHLAEDAETASIGCGRPTLGRLVGDLRSQVLVASTWQP